MPEKSWIDEIQTRARNGDNFCVVVELMAHSLGKSIEDDIKYANLADIEIPEDLKFRKELKAKFDKLVELCNEWGETQQAKWEEKMERTISKYERLK